MINKQIINKQIFDWLVGLLKATPKNLSLYLEALTHKSYANENNITYNYNKLEFLGDSIIGFLTAKYLYTHYKKENEGFYTSMKIRLVQSKTLAHAAKMIQLDKFVLLGTGSQESDNKDKIYEDAFEAIIAAVYLDLNNLDKCYQILNQTIFSLLRNNELEDVVDYKTLIQETLVKHNNNNNLYKIKVLEDGKYHATVVVNNINYGTGVATNKKDAEKLAAKDAYSKLASAKMLKE